MLEAPSSAYERGIASNTQHDPLLPAAALMRHDQVLHVAPRLPAGITRLGFRLRRRGLRLRVEADHETVRVGVLDGPGASIRVLLYDKAVDVSSAGPVECAVVPLTPVLPQPYQPPGYTLSGATDRPYGY